MPIFQDPSEGEGNLLWRETPREGEGRRAFRAFRAPGINFGFPFPIILSVGTGVNYCDMRNGSQAPMRQPESAENELCICDRLYFLGSSSFLTSN